MTTRRLFPALLEEAVIAARARARQTADDEVRYHDLVSRRAVSASEYDQARAAAESAKADLNAAEALADVARNETSYAVLLADEDGVVVETLAEPGQMVAAGQAVVRVAHSGRREAIVELPETLRPSIGSSARATLYGSPLTGSATLRQLSDAANRQTRTFEARYVLEGRLAEAPLGTTISIQIPAVQTAESLQNEKDGLSPFDAVVEATVQRSRPVILTALAAMLAFIPLTHSVFWGTLAYTLIGGTFGGTLITLLFLPALYAIWFRIQPAEKSGEVPVTTPTEPVVA